MVHLPFKDIKCSKWRGWLSFHFTLTATLCYFFPHWAFKTMNWKRNLAILKRMLLKASWITFLLDKERVFFVRDTSCIKTTLLMENDFMKFGYEHVICLPHSWIPWVIHFFCQAKHLVSQSNSWQANSARTCWAVFKPQLTGNHHVCTGYSYRAVSNFW